MSDRPGIAKRIALNGILAALAAAALLLATVAPTNRLSLYALSSVFVSVAIVESGIRNGWVFYLSSSILAAIIVPNKMALVPYFIFFGIYGLIKYHIEQIGRVALEYVLKIAYFNICLGAIILLAKEFFLSGIKVDFPLWVVVVLLETAFIAYDYAYSLFIRYYKDKLRKLVNIGS